MCNTTVCAICKDKLVEFYVFKLKAEEIRSLQSETFQTTQTLSHSECFNNLNNVTVEQNLKVEHTISSQSFEDSMGCAQLKEIEVSHARKSTNPRRPRNIEAWACNKRKTLRNSGLTYVNCSGKIIRGKVMQESCGSRCRNKCATKITDVDRQRNFDQFWAFADILKQREFIYKHIKSSEPKRRQSGVKNSNRSIVLDFFLDAHDESGNKETVKVCKKMFQQTLVVSSQVIQGVVKKFDATGFNDMRGKFLRKVTESQLLAIGHVKKFPFFYVENTLTKLQCYEMYRQECVEQSIEPVKESYYRDIFEKQNQGSFLKTNPVLCKTCDEYYKGSTEKRLNKEKEFDEHISSSINKKCRDRYLGRLRHKRRRNHSQTNTQKSYFNP